MRDERLVTIAEFSTGLEASLARGALENAGIQAYVPGEALGTYSRQRGAISEGVLQVFESDRDEAMAELRRLDFKIV